MTGAIAVLCGVLGLAIGSFLNVVVHRVPRGESVIRPRSHCPACDAPIAPRDDVPVISWLVLHGRCRQCQSPISFRYPLVELLTAAIFVGIGLRFAESPGRLPAYLYLAAIGVALAAIDLDVKRLPNAITLPSYLVGVALLAAAVAVGSGDSWSSFLRALAGLGAMYSFYFLLWYVTAGRGMGFGDVKLAGVLGLYLGFLGWQSWAVGLLAGFLLGGVGGIALMFAGRAGRKTKVPYGPFMVAGAFVAIIAGVPIVHGYLTLTTG